MRRKFRRLSIQTAVLILIAIAMNFMFLACSSQKKNPNYVYSETFSARKERMRNFLLVGKHGKEESKVNYGMIDLEKQRIVIRLKYKQIKFVDSSGYTAVQKNNKMALFNPKGKAVTPFKYDDIHFKKKLFAVVKNKKVGFIDSLGALKLAIAYDNAKNVSDSGYFVVQKDCYWGLVHPSGKELTDFEYDFMSPEANGYVQVVKHNKHGKIDTTGRVTIPIIYDEISLMHSDVAIVYLGGKLGLLENSGKEILPPIYDDIKGLSDGLRVVVKDGFYGFVNPVGEFIVPLKYEMALSFSEGLAAVFNGEKWGYIDTSGKVAIDFQFDGITYFSEEPYFKNGMAVVELDEKKITIGRDGSIID